MSKKIIPQLTRAEVQKMIEAFKRLQEIDGSPIVLKNTEIEKKGLQEFLLSQLFDHANEFLGCWLAAHEYDQLIHGFGFLLARANNMFTRQSPSQEGEDKQPENVVKL